MMLYDAFEWLVAVDSDSQKLLTTVNASFWWNQLIHSDRIRLLLFPNAVCEGLGKHNSTYVAGNTDANLYQNGTKKVAIATGVVY